MKGRVIYGILWVLTVVAYSLPWASIDGKSYTGWAFTLPFSITYLIGMILGLIVLITKRWAFSLTIVAGVLMLLGIAGAVIGWGMAAALEVFIGGKVIMEVGVGLAFILSIIYLICGAIIAKRMK